MNNSSTLEKIPYRGLSFTLWSPRQRSLLVSIMKETPAAYECANCRETFAAPDRGKPLMWKAVICFVGALFSIAPNCGDTLLTVQTSTYYGTKYYGSGAAAFCLVGFILIFVGFGLLFLKEARRARCPVCGCSEFSRLK